jgi:hypothetical protein
MSALVRPPNALLIFIGGFLLGMLSWFASLTVSGKFEPYDSTYGLLANQLVLSGATAALALRYRPQTFFLCLLGSYVGMNVYAYAFGGSEHKVWALLGAFSSVFLIVLPGLIGVVAATIRRLRLSSRSHP